MNKRMRAGAAVVLLGLAVAGCHSDSNLDPNPYPALEIVGTDQDDVDFKLSDYRGKVVMLDFYGNWCLYCTKMYPHNRSLVTKLKDKPFVLLGVNTDPSREELQDSIKNGLITWRSWWDGPHRPGSGPISLGYQIDGFPTVFLIDHKGRVRKKYVGPPEDAALEKAINVLIQEAVQAMAE